MIWLYFMYTHTGVYMHDGCICTWVCICVGLHMYGYSGCVYIIDVRCESVTCNSCNIGTSDLRDMYAQSPRAAGPRAEVIHIRQIMSAYVTTNM